MNSHWYFFNRPGTKVTGNKVTSGLIKWPRRLNDCEIFCSEDKSHEIKKVVIKTNNY